MRRLNKSELYNIKKAQQLSKKGYIVGEVSFKSREAAKKRLLSSAISKERKKRLSIIKFKNINTGRPIYIFKEKRR